MKYDNYTIIILQKFYALILVLFYKHITSLGILLNNNILPLLTKPTKINRTNNINQIKNNQYSNLSLKNLMYEYEKKIYQ